MAHYGWRPESLSLDVDQESAENAPDRLMVRVRFGVTSPNGARLREIKPYLLVVLFFNENHITL